MKWKAVLENMQNSKESKYSKAFKVSGQFLPGIFNMGAKIPQPIRLNYAIP